ncbi:MAG: FHA domain-containing protein [Brevefilum sp.]
MQIWFKLLIAQNHRGHIFAPDGFIWRMLVLALVCIFALSGLLPHGQVQGQAEDGLLVKAPDTSAFPHITVQFKLSDNIDLAGEDLRLTQLQVLEDGRDVSITTLKKEKRGVYFTMAINGGRELDLRDANGISNFDKLRKIIVDFASSREDFPEDAWSLIANDSPNLINVSENGAWLEALKALTPDFRKMSPDLTSLSTAIQIAEERVVPFGVDKALLYLTPPPAANQIDEIFNLTEKARSAGIRVNVWMVGDPLFLNNDQGRALMSLAEVTGGTFFHYTGKESPPNPSAFLSNLGFIYTLQYESLIRDSGTFPLQITINQKGETYQGECPPFFLDVRLPEPVLVNPPTAISRSADIEAERASGKFSGEDLRGALFPDRLSLEFLVKFPDGYPREITASRLLVNGVVVAENNSPPFDTLIWNLAEINQSGEQIIQVEITDSLGLSGRTNEYPVRVVVTAPEPESGNPAFRLALIGGGVLLGLGTLMLCVFLGLRLFQRVNLNQLRRILVEHINNDADVRDKSGGNPEKTYATLIPTGRLDQDWENHVIRITKRNGIFGNRVGRVDYLLQGDGVDEMQARLTLRDDFFWLNDLESNLGTWVNYRRIGTNPVSIHPGDLIHFGNSGFRFTILNNTQSDGVHLTPYEPLI